MIKLKYFMFLLLLTLKPTFANADYLNNDELDLWAKNQGYTGYTGKHIVNMIYHTQREGGLEQYVGQILGCNSSDKKICGHWYPMVKINQVLNDALMYEFSEYVNDNDYFEFHILTNKEPGAIYQENQSLSKKFYVFKGMVSFETNMGTIKTIPYFEVLNPQPSIQ
ncbi:hypothetical protein TW85_24715 [Marinomonas sp. S3726]|uniref:hypothetical protein n=1 Tax=Marinomonas sp. S3726 TaxID=579484 RepID=UPI0005FA0FE1|nr:hypothetical protein [Marinomonas sp. S3726]KJZ07801.1 hypothetical protein TW85_24715 [Marinomonas sp. S3726]